jgi:hypothetical protein
MADPGQQPECDADECGVHTALVDQTPGRQTERYVRPPGAYAQPLQQGVQRKERERAEQRQEGQLGCEEDRDDRDGQQVVDHCERQQERAKRRG